MALLYSPISPLYHSLHTPEVPKLDQAVLYGQTRAFQESLAIFESFTTTVKQHPVIAYEYSTVLYAQGRPKDSASVIKDALQHQEQQQADALGIYKLLRLSLACMNVFSEGNFVQVRDSVKEIRSWLISMPIEDYTPLQVLCIRRYYAVVLMIANYASTFDFRKLTDIPPKAVDSEESGLLNLFKHLQAQGRLHEGLQLLKIVQCFRLDEKTSEDLLSEHIYACTQHDSPARVWYCEGQARLLLATLFAKSADVHRAQEEFDCASRTFSRAPVPETLNNLKLEVKVAHIRHDQINSHDEKLALWTALSEENVNSDFTTTGSVLGYAFEAAVEVYKERPSEASKATILQLQAKLDCLYEEAGDPYSLYLFHIYDVDSAALHFNDLGAVLKWHEQFDETHPEFALWDSQLVAKKRLLGIYNLLNDHDNQYKTAGEIRAITLDCDSFWREDDGKSQGVKISQPNFSIDGKFTNVLGRDHDVDEEEGFDWYSEWLSNLLVFRNDIPGVKASSFVSLSSGIADDTEPLFKTLLRWLQSASATDELMEEQLESILMISFEVPRAREEPGGVHPRSIRMSLEKMTPRSLQAAILGISASPVPSSLFQKGFSVLSEWLLGTHRYFETKRHALLAKLFSHRISSQSFLMHVKLEDQIHETEKFQDLFPRLNAEARKLFNFHALLWKTNLASLKINLVGTADGPLCDDTSAEFGEILALCESVRDESQKIGNLYLESLNMAILVRFFTFSALKSESAFQRFVMCFVDAEKLVERRRVGLKALTGWDKVEKLLLSLQEIDWAGLAHIGILVVRNVPDSHEAMRNNMIWAMMQFSKSLGLGWLTETNTRTYSEPKGQDSKDISFQSLEAISKDSGSDVVFVEWIGPPSSCSQSELPLIVISHQGGPPKVRPIKLSWDKVESMIKDFLDLDENGLINGEAARLLRKLAPLVEYLSEVTSPGQVLVLCPFGSLHRVPLHALEVDGQPLIRRNPVVYTSSMTVLNVAFMQRKTYEKSAVDSNLPWKAALFGDPPSSDGKKALQTLADQFASPACIEDEFTPSNFCSALHGADLLHFHGHGAPNEEDPLDNGLSFDVDCHLTLRDVFDLSPSTDRNPSPSQTPAFHATLLACGSGTSEKDRHTNDVIGLVSAFLYTGASSTVSTLWSFSDADAALFSHAFYEAFDKPLALHRSGADARPSQEDQRVDLAKATQRAILAIMEIKPELYHWAPFVLNGYWMFGVRG